MLPLLQTSNLPLLCGVVIILLLLYLLIRPYIILRAQPFYYPPCWPLFGHQLNLIGQGFQVYHLKWLNSLRAQNPIGLKILALLDGLNLSYVVAEPKILSKILISDFSTFPDRKLMILHQKCIAKSIIAQDYKEWQVGRKVLVGTFTTSMLKTMLERNVKCTIQLLTGPIYKIEPRSDYGYPLRTDGTPFEAKTLFGTYAIDIITKNALGFKLEIGSVEHKTFMKNCQEIFTYEMCRLSALSWFNPLTKFVTAISNISFVGESSLIYIRDVICHMASLRFQSVDHRKDLYQIMMNAAQKHSKLLAKSHDEPTQLNGCPFNINQIPSFGEENVTANAIFIVLAAYDTLSTALSWVVYHLACRPHLQDKIYEEIKVELELGDNLAKKQIDPWTNEIVDVNYDSLYKLTYTEMFIKEVLRIDPPLAVVNRVASRDWSMEVNVSNAGNYEKVAFKQGTVIDVPIYSIHHDPTYWPKPEMFDPERFAPNETIPKCTYLPFGIGPRNCAAEKFAMLTMKAFLAVALQKVKFVTCPSTQPSCSPQDVSFKKNEFHYPKSGIWLAAVDR